MGVYTHKSLEVAGPVEREVNTLFGILMFNYIAIFPVHPNWISHEFVDLNEISLLSLSSTILIAKKGGGCRDPRHVSKST